MNTNNVYYADAYIVISRKDNGDTIHIRSKELKPVLVLYKKNIFGKVIAKDLNNNKKYGFSATGLKIGKIWCDLSSLQPFNKRCNNIQNNLSKRKIKEIGNTKLY